MSTSCTAMEWAPTKEEGRLLGFDDEMNADDDFTGRRAGCTRTRVQCPSRRPRSRRALDAFTNTRDNDMENDYYSIDAILAESQVNCFVSPTILVPSDIPSESPLCIQGRDPRPWVSRRRLREGCKCSMTLKRSSYVHRSSFRSRRQASYNYPFG